MVELAIVFNCHSFVAMRRINSTGIVDKCQYFDLVTNKCAVSSRVRIANIQKATIVEVV